ncbi:WD40 repeat domain-containing protein [Kitasatospora sp. NPDC001664]
MSDVLFTAGSRRLPSGRIELAINQEGGLTVRRLTAERTESRGGAVDPAVHQRLRAALRTTPGTPGRGQVVGLADGRVVGPTEEPAARQLTVGESSWADGTDTPVPPVGRLLEALAVQLLQPLEYGQLPFAVVRPETAGAVDEALRPAAVIGTVGGAPAYALADGAAGFDLGRLPGGASLGGSDGADGLLPTAVALAEVAGRELFALGAADGAVQVWDADTGELAHGTSGGEGAQLVAAGLIGGVPLVFSGGSRGELRAWQAEDGRGLGLLAVGGEGVTALLHARVAGLDLVVAGAPDGTVRVWDAARGARLQLLVGHSAPVTALAVLPLGEQALLATGGRDHEVRLWDLATGSPVAEFSGHSATVTGLAFAELDGRPVLFSAALDNTLRSWDVHAAEALGGRPAGGSWLTGLVTVPAAGTAQLASGDEHGRIRFWELNGGKPVGSCEPEPTTAGPVPVNALAVGELHGRPVLAAGYGDGRVRLWDAGTRTELYALEPDGGPVASVAVLADPDGPVLVCGTVAGAVRCHRLKDGAPLSVPTPHTGPVTALAFAAAVPGAEAVLLSGGSDGTVRVRQALDGLPVRQLTAHRGGVTALTVGEVGGRRVLASAGKDRTVRLWDVDAGQAGPVLDGLAAPAEALALGTLDGRAVLLVGCADGTVRARDVLGGHTLAELPGGSAEVRSLVCQVLDGEVLVAAGDESSVLRLWHLASGSLVNEAPLDRIPLAIAFGEAGLHVVGPGGPVTL